MAKKISQYTRTSTILPGDLMIFDDMSSDPVTKGILVSDILAALKLAKLDTQQSWTADQVLRNLIAAADNAYDVGTASVLWRLIYAYRLRLKSDGTNAPLRVYDGSDNTLFQVGATGVPVIKGRSPWFDAVMYCAFDGPRPYETDLSGDTRTSLGQAATGVNGAVIFRPGRFGKAVQIAEATTNICRNPSFESGNVGSQPADFTPQGGSNVTAVNSSDCSVFGVRSAKITCTAGGNGLSLIYIPTIPAANTNYTFSFYARRVDGTPVVAADFYTVMVVAGSNLSPTVIDCKNGWYRLVYAHPNNVAQGDNYIRFYTGVGSWYIDGMQLEQKAYTTPYCDGSMGTGHSWSGTAHASTSSRTACNLNYSNPFKNKTTTGSISIWFKREDISVSDRYILDTGYGSANNNIVIYHSSNGNFTFFHMGAGQSSYCYAPAYARDNLWHHLAVCWDDSAAGNLRQRMWIDNVEYVGINGTYTAMAPGGDYIQIGISKDAAYQMNGYFDDLMILDRAITADEVASIYLAGAPIDAPYYRP